jgi:hypothetical protein
MKRATIFWHFLCLGSFMVFLSGCSSSSPHGASVVASPSGQSTLTSPTPDARASPSRTIQLLRPDAPVPASCPLTPVYTGGPSGVNIPWLHAQPASAGIAAYLAYSGVGPSGTYRLPHINGFFPQNGLYTKTLWAIDNQEASNTLLIDGTDLSDVTRTFHDTGNAAFGPGFPTGRNMHTYTSYLQAPNVGCWRLRVTSGHASANITMWFVG